MSHEKSCEAAHRPVSGSPGRQDLHKETAAYHFYSLDMRNKNENARTSTVSHKRAGNSHSLLSSHEKKHFVLCTFCRDSHSFVFTIKFIIWWCAEMRPGAGSCHLITLIRRTAVSQSVGLVGAMQPLTRLFFLWTTAEKVDLAVEIQIRYSMNSMSSMKEH